MNEFNKLFKLNHINITGPNFGNRYDVSETDGEKVMTVQRVAGHLGNAIEAAEKLSETSGKLIWNAAKIG